MMIMAKAVFYSVDDDTTEKMINLADKGYITELVHEEDEERPMREASSYSILHRSLTTIMWFRRLCTLLAFRFVIHAFMSS